ATRQAGGALRPDDPTYVARRADQALYDAIVSGEFSYVLTSRQMGKSSLVARMARQLRDENWHVCVVDLSAIGSASTVTEDRWYYGLAYRIAQDLQIVQDFKAWWADHSELTRAQLFSDFIGELVLTQCSERIAIFIDEIDSTLPLDFTDDFFAAVRAIYNARATDETYSRISITLLGVATPDRLIQDKRRTPFNIGTRIDLNDFTLQQVTEGPGKTLDQDRVERVYHWTNGHPYLTQRLMKEVDTSESVQSVDEAVKRLFIDPNFGEADSNLELTAARLTGDDGDVTSQQRTALNIYRQILAGKKIEEDPQSVVHNELKLSGIVRVGEKGHLMIRNRIYQQAFDKAWVKSTTAADKQLKQVRYQAVAATAAMALIAFVLWYLYFYPQQLIREMNLVTEDKVAAESIAERLRRVPGRETSANRSLAEFWERKAVAAEYTDAGTVHLLDAYREYPTPYREVRLYNELTGGVRLADPLVAAVRHEEEVIAAAFSSDGQRMLTGSLDNTARLWDAATGEAVTPPLQHESWVSSVAISADGEKLLTGSDDNTAQVWDAETGEALTPPLRHDDPLSSVVFSADGQKVLTGSMDGTARVWDAVTGEALTPLLRHESWVRGVAFSPDGQKVMTASTDGTAQVWDAATGDALTPPLGHEDTVNAVAFSADGQLVVTASMDSTARVWNAISGEALTPPLRHNDIVWTVEFNPDGQKVLTSSDDGTARVWDARTGEELLLLHHGNRVNTAAFSADGQQVVSGGRDGTVKVWNATTGKLLTQPLRHGRDVVSVAFSSDGQRVLTGSADGTARVWDARSGDAHTPRRHSDSVWPAAFSADGQKVLTGSWDHTARIWNAFTGDALSPPLSHDDAVNSVAFSADGQKVVTGSRDKTAQVWDATSGKAVTPPLKHDDVVSAVVFSSDEQRVLTGSWDRTARIWDAATGDALTPPLSHEGSVESVAFSADGQKVLTSSADNTARVWDAKTGEALTPPLTHDGSVRSVAFSVDAQQVLTGSMDGTARVWDAATGEAVTPPLRHENRVTDVAFSANAQQVLTGSADGTARVWDAVTGAALTQPLRHEGSVESVAFSPNGQHALTVSAGSVREWSSDTGELLGEYVSGFGVSLQSASYSADGQSIGIASDWTMTQITRNSDTGPVLPKHFSPNQLSALSQLESIDDRSISLFPVVDVHDRKAEDLAELRATLLKKFVLEEDDKGTLFYPYKVIEEEQKRQEQVDRY
nr:AAA-like domain-containing protein [Granulosicoccus sp.]